MPRKRYTEEQIVSILGEARLGAKTIDLCRKYGVSENTFYKWRECSGSANLGHSLTDT